jgi:plasmid stabilization system protein ParE
MAFKIVFHPKAELEYIEAFHWYENEGLGDRFEKLIEKKLNQIQLHPENYGVNKGGFRETSVDIFPYSIVYKILKRKGLIYIPAIFLAKRNPKNKFRK